MYLTVFPRKQEKGDHIFHGPDKSESILQTFIVVKLCTLVGPSCCFFFSPLESLSFPTHLLYKQINCLHLKIFLILLLPPESQVFLFSASHFFLIGFCISLRPPFCSLFELGTPFNFTKHENHRPILCISSFHSHMLKHGSTVHDPPRHKACRPPPKSPPSHTMSVSTTH